MAGASENDGTVNDIKQQLREALERKQRKASHTEHPVDAHFVVKGRDAGPGRAKFFRRKTG
jgi:hypothetical protein